MINDPVSEALELFKSGFNCSQAVLAAFSEECGISKETTLKIACPFGGGIGGYGRTCGALTGGLMVIGLKYGATKATNLEAKKLTHEKSRELIEYFEEKYGTSLCRDLVGFDTSTLSNAEMIAKSPHFQKTCPKFLETVTIFLEEEF